jgi:hypothetical protein
MAHEPTEQTIDHRATALAELTHGTVAHAQVHATLAVAEAINGLTGYLSTQDIKVGLDLSTHETLGRLRAHPD